jgi:hypothetical protein
MKMSRPYQRAAVLDPVKARACGAAEERPALTASARAGLTFPRSGREKACGAVEQEKG